MMTYGRAFDSRGKRGAALLLALGYLAVVMAMSATFYSALNRTWSRSRAQERHVTCLNIAEGGLNKAVASLRASGGAYHGERDTVLGDGVFSVEVQDGGQPGAYHVVSTGVLRNGDRIAAQARVVADVQAAPGGLVRVLRWTEARKW